MPANMTPPEFGATVAHQYISEPVVKTVVQEEINEIVEKPEIVSAIHVDRTARITISPEVIAEASAPSPEKEEDVIPYKL